MGDRSHAGPVPDFRLLFESGPDPYLVLDRDFTIVAATNAYLRATMTSREQILGRDIFQVFPDNPDDPAATGVSNLRASLDRVVQYGITDAMAVYKHDVRRSPAEGGGMEERHWSPTNSPVLSQDGELNYIIHRVEDVTEFVRLRRNEREQETTKSDLRERAEQAQEQLRAQVAETDKAKKLAEAASVARGDFLARLSHELRTPMNAILGFAQILNLDELDDDQRESVAQIISGGQHLLSLINEVLDITSIQSGRLTLTPVTVSLEELARESIESLQPLADSRRIRLINRVVPGATAFGDRARLKQVLIHLLSNAVKYNREGGSVRLEAARLATDPLAGPETGVKPAGVRLEVTDTGYGIAPAGLTRVFAPFERLDAALKGVEGAGIGLTISQRLIELMDGRIGVDSVVGQGSTFWVNLPCGVDETVRKGGEGVGAVVAALAGDGAQEGNLARTVLYIEDNLSNLNLIEHILAHRDHVRLLAAMQGRLGLEMAERYSPDLILLDVHLPDIHGYEVLLHLRESAATRDIPVVMLSADATVQQKERMLHAGAKYYLTKPLDVKQFLRVLDETLLQEGLPTASWE